MFEIVKKIINEQISRVSQNKSNKCIPMRPDHGNKILDDISAFPRKWADNLCRYFTHS